MNSIQNSRRSFLSSMAILTSGTLLAGSPLNFLQNNNGGSIEQTWEQFVLARKGTPFLNIDAVNLLQVQAIAGQTFKAGSIISFEAENMLAQPTWIYWDNNKKPADIVVSFFESCHPYKKIRSINRFELEAIAKISETAQQDGLLKAVCSGKHDPANRLLVKIRNGLFGQRNDICLYQKNNMVWKQQSFYNA